MVQSSYPLLPCFLNLAVVLLAVNLSGFRSLPRFRYRYIVNHPTEYRVDNLERIRSYYRRESGRSDAAYHLILSNGSTQVPEGYLEATGRYRHLSYNEATRSRFFNLNGIHQCVVGNYESDRMPEDLGLAFGHAVQLMQEKSGIPGGNIQSTGR